MTVLTDALARPVVAGWLAAAAIGIGVVLTIVFSRALEFELIETPTDASALVGPKGDFRRRRAAVNTWIDFLFIACYTVTLIVVALLVLEDGAGWARALGIFAVAVALLTAAADVLENRAILDLLGEDRFAQSSVDRVRRRALVKWGLLWIVLGTLSLPLLLRGDRFAWIGGLFVLAALAGAIGLLPVARRLLKLAGGLLAAGLVASAFLFLRFGGSW